MAAKDGAHHTQILKGVLEMCLLASIAEQPNYGYAVVRDLNSWGLEIKSERSIYPPLRRLEADGHIESYLESSTEGPARKYYRATDPGRETLAEWIDGWIAVRIGVDAVISGQLVPRPNTPLSDSALSNSALSKTALPNTALPNTLLEEAT